MIGGHKKKPTKFFKMVGMTLKVYFLLFTDELNIYTFCSRDCIL